MADLTSLTATEILSLIRSRSVSAVEVLEAHLARVDEENRRINAVVTLDAEGARLHARAADEAAARGESLGLLHGLPMTLKDGHSTAGMLTTSGYKPLRDYVPSEDGTVAARLKAAGAIIFGKTNVSPLLGDIQSYNVMFGRTNNPYDVERTSGGSSGGAAAALAAGMTPLEIGSDLAGSIRIPSAFCGVYGLKTTEHRVSMWGHIPDVPGVPRSHRLMWSIGPMARSISDLALCYQCIAGPDGKDMDVPAVSLGDISVKDRERRPFKLAWAPTFPGVPVSNAVRDALVGVVRTLEREGVHVEERLPDVSFEETEEARVVVSRAVRLTFRSDVEHTPATLKEYMEALDTREKVTRVWEEFFGDWDALLCPVLMTTAFPHCPNDDIIMVDGEPVEYWNAIGHCSPFNFTGQPSIALPVGWDANGLPIGLQLVSRRWSEQKLLWLAEQVAGIVGFEQRLSIGGQHGI